MSIFSFLLKKHCNILADLPETVLVIDEYGKILYANTSAKKLFETSKIYSKNINDYFMINSDNIIKNKDGDTKQILKLVTEKQNTKITDVKITDISSRNNKRYILTIIDNTHEHSLFDELIAERQNKKILNHTKNLLLSKMNNCLTSPLHSIVGFSQAMLSGLSGDLNDKQKKYLEIINSNSSELLLFIQKLIEMSEIEEDIYKFSFDNFDFLSLLYIVLNEHKLKITNKNIKITLNTDDLASNTCYSDKNAIKNILTNIIENAIELIETGAIYINLSNPVSDLLISKGIEIDAGFNEKSYIMCEILCKGLDESLYNNTDIFDPYVQADINSKKYLLQSLLLCNAKKLATGLNGVFWVNNQYANQVSFIFAIPAAKIPLTVE